jgi:hypothetical protein
MYVLAVKADRRLGVLMTMRSGESDDAAGARDELQELRRRYPTGIAGTQPRRWYKWLVRAMQELADAETARGLDLPGQAAQWHRAPTACHQAQVA